MMQPLQKLLDQLRGLWRFRWIGVMAAWVVLLLALLVITLLPDRYQGSATVFVNTQTALSAATRSLSIDTNVESQIQRVREALLGGPQLAKIADETGLTAKATTPQERQKVIDKLRWEIQISGNVNGQGPGSGTYVISYAHRDRETSLKVVDRFVNTFVEETLGGKRADSEQTQQFLAEQIAGEEKQLRSSEEALATFKKEHVGLLPGEQKDYFQRLDAELVALDAAQTKLSVANTRRSAIQQQLRGEQPLIPGVPERPNAVAGSDGDTATRLRQSQKQLDELLLSFTEKHPKVVELRNNIAQLEKRQAEEMDAARRGDVGAAARSGLTTSLVYQNLQLQYNEVGVEIAGLQADIANRSQRVAKLRGMMNTAPEVEAQYTSLNRDYGVVKARYEALVDQLGRARLGEQAAQTGVVGFDIVDPARASFDPVFPKRPLLAIAALMGSVVAGFGVAFLLNVLRPVFGSVQHLHEVTGLPVLGAVSMTWIERHDLRLRRSALVLVGSLVGMVLLCGAFLAVHRQLANAFKVWMA